MKTYQSKVKIRATAEQVFELLTDPKFAEKDALLEGAITAKAKIESDDGKTKVLVIEREEYGRGPGGKTQDKHETNISTQKWDLAAKRAKWSTRVVGKEKLVEIKGETWVATAADDTCVLCEKGSVNIKILVIGDIIAKGIANDLEKDFPKKKDLFEQEING